MPPTVLQQLKTFDIEVIEIPLIKTLPLPYHLPEKSFDWLFFTSVNAVDYFDFSKVLQPVKIMALGNQTAEAIRKKGLEVEFQPQCGYSEALMVEWAEKNVLPQTICLPHSGQARTVIKEGLEDLGHQVTDITTYDLIFPKTSQKLLKDLLLKQNIEYAIFASPSAWRNFYQVVSDYTEDAQQLIRQLNIISIGPVTTHAIQQAGAVVALEPDVHDMVHLYRQLFQALVENDFKR